MHNLNIRPRGQPRRTAGESVQNKFMAYMSQEKKSLIAAELKKVIPPTWKWSLSVVHHSTIRLTISAAPVDLIREHLPSEYIKPTDTYLQLNEYHLEYAYRGELLQTFEKIKEALNLGNWDKSDVMTDYFDVGHYVNLHIGRWDKPFQALETREAELDRLKAQLAAMEPA